MLNGIQDMPADLAGLLIERSGREPGRLAFRFLPDGEEEGGALTYGALDRRARELAAQLLALGATGSRAVLVHPPGLEYIEALFGCWYAGVVPVPAYPPRPGRPLRQLARLASDAGVRFALTGLATRQRLERGIAAEPVLAALTWVQPGASDPASRDAVQAVPRPRGSLALLQYTSGSTSAPKGVMLSHENLLAHATALVERLGATPEDHEVSWLPPYHDMGLIGAIVAPVLGGVGATLMPPGAFLQRPLRWLEAVTRFGGTITGGPDFAWDLCARRATPAQLASLDLGGLRVAFSGAERVRPETLERFAAVFGPAGFRRSAFAPCYGLAEATLGVTFRPPGAGPLVEAFDEQALGRGRAERERPGAPARWLAGSGAPLPGCEVRVVDPETRRPLEAGEVGEIWARGPGVASGYWNQAELSERTFGARLAFAPEGETRWLRTGDLGFLRAGELFVTGRLKDLLVLAGFNHYPEDIEVTATEAHPGLRPRGGAAFSVEVGGAERLVVVLEVADRRRVHADEMVAAVRGAIGEAHEVPVHEVVLVAPGGVPRTSSGKVQRSLCRARYLAGELEVLARGGRAAAAAAPPAPAMVERVAGLMAGVLGVGWVGPEDDFFALGGHSLLATQLISRLRDAVRVEVPLRAVFEAPTPSALASRLEACAPAEAATDIPSVDLDRPVRLSFSQERMWYLHQLDPGRSAYNVAGAVVVDGPLDAGVLRRALQVVIDGHEVFRTRYAVVDGTPLATFGPPLQLPLEAEDLSARDDPEAAAVALAGDLAALPFDLERDALVRLRLFRLAPERHVLALCAHHVVVDGWALGVLLDEVLAAYGALAAGRAPAPRRAGPSFADYAAWQRDQLRPEVATAEVEHWRRQLEGAPLLELATDRPRGPNPTRRGALEPLDLPGELWDRLRDLARTEGVTLYMVMLAAFEVLLHRHTGQTDVVVGTPVANRNRAVAEGLVGTLVNTLPMRVTVDPEGSFRQLLGAVQETVLDALAHQELPFERVVAALPVQRRAGQTPLFPVLFDFLNAPMPARRAGPLRLRPLAFSRRASQFDLSLSVIDTALGHLVAMEYRTDLFDAATIRRLGGHYRAVLEAVAASPTLPISRIPLLTATEREEAVARAGAACQGRPADVPVPELFEAQAARTPEAVAVVDGAGALTYGEVLAQTRALCSRLRKLGAGPGQRVAVCLNRTRALPVALLAALRAGAAYVPLDPRYPTERLAWMLEDAAPAVLVTEEALRATLPASPGTAVLSLDAAPAGPEPLLPPGAPGPDDPAYVIYTSGSTGRPKGVEVTHLGLSNLLDSMSRTPGLTQADRLLSVTTVSFDIAALEIFLPLVTGAQLHLASAEEAADGVQLAALLQRSDATVMQATPSTWRLLLDAGWAGHQRLRILCGGEALPRDLADRLLERGAELWNLYGPTETTIWSALLRVGPDRGPVPIGFPVAHTRLYVLDRHGDPTPVGVPGEIHIGGAGVARGYWRRPDLTDRAFIPDPLGGPGARMYRTGDLGRFRPDGALECLGRADHQVKIRGHRVELGEIEAVLREHPGVAEAVVVAREAGPGDLRLAAYFVPRSVPGPGRAELREILRRKLPEPLLPTFLVPLEALPLTPNGKLDRRSLPAPNSAHTATDAARVAPRDDLEATLAGLFGEVLGTPVTSVRDGFFDLGGHSLLAARLFARLEQVTGVTLALGALLEHQTVEQLAALVRQRRDAPAPASAHPTFVVPIRARGERPPFFCVHGAGGNVLNLVDLGRYLSPDRPFHGVQARGVDGRSAPFGSVEEMATAYLEEIRLLQPHGPYFLGGYCGGGLVAYQMAQQLLSEGEQVAFLALIDSPGPGRPPPLSRFHRWSRTLVDEDAVELLRRARAKWHRDLGAAQRRATIRSHLASGEAVPHELRDAWLTDAYVRTSARYRIRPYPGRLVVFQARDATPGGPVDLGWHQVAAGGLVVEEVPGDHNSLAQEPHVQVLGARLEAALREAEEEAARRAVS